MPSLSLINSWGPCPPNGFRYVFPQDGYTAHAWTYVDWVEEARKHCRVNSYSLDGLEAKMEHQLCLTLDPGWCNYDSDSRPRPSVVLGWAEVENALKVFGGWLAQGCRTVEQNEAERRALICSRCYLNVTIGGCSGCQKLIGNVVGRRSTKYDYALRGCAVCKCVLRAKVHFPQSLLDRENEKMQELYPSFCWLKKEGENYHG